MQRMDGRESYHLDFSAWSQRAWRSLDVADLVVRMAPQYCWRIQSRYPAAEREDVVQEFIAEALPRVQSAHQRHLEVTGRRRTQVIVGTLDAVADQMARGGSRRLRMGGEHEPYDPGVDDHYGWAAAADHWCPDYVPEPPEASDLASVERLERVRHRLTSRQYEVLYRQIALREPAQVTAQHYQVTHQAISRVTVQARRRLEALVPDESAREHA